MHKKKKILYVICILISIIILALGYSFAYFTKRLEVDAVNLIVGNLEYILESTTLTNNQIRLLPNSSKIVDLKLTSKNLIDSKYEIYYKIISSEDLTESTNGGYLEESENPPFGIIEKQSTKNMEILLNNLSNQEIIIEVGIKAGLMTNELKLNEDENSLTNLSINAAYKINHWLQNVDGDKTLKDESNYTLQETETSTGLSSSIITPTTKTYTGFTSPETQSYSIQADGNLTIDYYYTRNSYSVTLNKGTGISTVTGAGSYLYGQSVTINSTVASGYSWVNWTGTSQITTQKYTFTMPENDVSYTANAKTTIPSNYIFMSGTGFVNGYSLTQVQNDGMSYSVSSSYIRAYTSSTSRVPIVLATNKKITTLGYNYVYVDYAITYDKNASYAIDFYYGFDDIHESSSNNWHTNVTVTNSPVSRRTLKISLADEKSVARYLHLVFRFATNNTEKGTINGYIYNIYLG